MTEPAKPRSKFFQASAWLFAMTMLANVCNYFFHAGASRLLGPADYGALVAMLAMITMLVLPGQSIQLVLAKRVAVDVLNRQHARVSALGQQVLWHLLTAGTAAGLLLLLFREPVARFFRLPDAAPVLAVGGAVFVTLLLYWVRGFLQGLERFGALGANMAADGLLRLGCGLGLIAVGWGVTGGLLATLVSSLLVIILAAFSLHDLAGHRPSAAGLDMAAFYGSGFPILVSLLAFTALSSMDVVMVKHYFPAELAGYYAAGAIVGKAFLFLPLAVAQVLFPKVCASREQGQACRPLLHKSLLATTGMLVPAAALLFAAASWVVVTLFGRTFVQPETVMLVRAFGWVMTPLALVYLLMHYALALEQQTFVWMVLADVPVFLAGLAFWHGTLGQVLLVAGINHALLAIAGYCVARGADARNAARA